MGLKTKILKGLNKDYRQDYIIVDVSYYRYYTFLKKIVKIFKFN